MTCGAKSELGNMPACQKETGHRGMHWSNMSGCFFSSGDNKDIRRQESEIIKNENLVARLKTTMRPEGSPCNCYAGLCPKFEYTAGESHRCNLPIFHNGEHRCAHCEKNFNSDSVAPWVYQLK